LYISRIKTRHTNEIVVCRPIGSKMNVGIIVVYESLEQRNSIYEFIVVYQFIIVIVNLQCLIIIVLRKEDKTSILLIVPLANDISDWSHYIVMLNNNY